MHLRDLSPDIRFQPLPRDEDALRFTFEAKRAALGPHIATRWGWDEALQLRMHKERFDEKPFFKIMRDGCEIGALSFMRNADHLRFGEFYLLPAHQRQGHGTRVLRHCLTVADEHALPVRLEYLKWNPVGSLYRRHGFIAVGETEIHWLMRRMPKSGSGDP